MVEDIEVEVVSKQEVEKAIDMEFSPRIEYASKAFMNPLRRSEAFAI